MRLLLTFISFFLFSQLHTQSICSFNKSNVNLYEILNSITNSDDDISEIVSLISNEIGVYPNYILQRAEGLGTCIAAEDENRLRYIVYDRDFLQYMSKVSETNYWAVVFILAHEVGHHVSGHLRKTINVQDSWQKELEADSFAGFILNKLNGNKEDIEKILSQITDDLYSYSDTHPSINDRIQAANEGFEKAELNLTTNQSEVVNSMVMTSKQIATNIEVNSRKTIDKNIVNPKTIKGKAFKEMYKYSNPTNWYISGYSDLKKSDNGCFIFQYWREDYSHRQAPAHIKNNPTLAAMAISDNQGLSYASYDLNGEDAFVFIVKSTTKKVINRTKKIFKTNQRIKNTSDDLFPEKAWTNRDKTKLLYVTELNEKDFDYQITFIDLKGYQEIYNCLSENEKKKFINPDRILNILNEF